MRGFSWARRGSNDRSPRSEKELGAAARRPILEERLAELQRIDPGIQIKLEDTEDHQQLKGGYELGEIDPTTFVDQVSEDHGGGRYKVRFIQDGKGLTLRNGQQESYNFGVEGERRRRSRKERAEAKNEVNLSKLLAALLGNEAVMKLVTGFFGLITGRDGQPDHGAMMNQILEGVSKIQEMSSKYDPVDQLKKLAELQSSLSRPPITTGGSSSFLEGLAKPFADAFASKVLPPGAQAPQPALSASPALSPAGPPTTETPPASAPAPAGITDADAARGILSWVRWLVSIKYDAEEAAAYGVDALSALDQVGAVPAQMRGLLQQADPSMAAGFFPALIPELNQDQVYGEQFKAAAMRHIQEAQRQSKPEEAAQATEAGEAEATHVTEDAEIAVEPTPDEQDHIDGEPGDAQGDQG